MSKIFIVLDNILLTPQASDLMFEELATDDDLVIVSENARVPVQCNNISHKNWLRIDREFREHYTKGLPDIKMLLDTSGSGFINMALFYAWKERTPDTVVCILGNVEHGVDYKDKVPIGKMVSAYPFKSTSGWINPLGILQGEKRFYARGFPFEYRSDSPIIGNPKNVYPSFNQGLHTGMPDTNPLDNVPFDYYDKTIYPIIEPFFISLRQGQWLPLSIGNCQFRQKLIPAFWQPPEFVIFDHQRITGVSDTWSMFILKSLMDKTDDVVTVGPPVLRRLSCETTMPDYLGHHLAGSVQTLLFDVVKVAASKIAPTSYADMTFELSENLKDICFRLRKNYDSENLFVDVILRYARGLSLWAGFMGRR